MTGFFRPTAVGYNVQQIYATLQTEISNSACTMYRKNSQEKKKNSEHARAIRINETLQWAHRSETILIFRDILLFSLKQKKTKKNRQFVLVTATGASTGISFSKRSIRNQNYEWISLRYQFVSLIADNVGTIYNTTSTYVYFKRRNSCISERKSACSRPTANPEYFFRLSWSLRACFTMLSFQILIIAYYFGLINLA